jgi:hypothetical protein
MPLSYGYGEDNIWPCYYSMPATAKWQERLECEERAWAKQPPTTNSVWCFIPTTLICLSRRGVPPEWRMRYRGSGLESVNIGAHLAMTVFVLFQKKLLHTHKNWAEGCKPSHAFCQSRRSCPGTRSVASTAYGCVTTLRPFINDYRIRTEQIGYLRVDKREYCAQRSNSSHAFAYSRLCTDWGSRSPHNCAVPIVL